MLAPLVDAIAPPRFGADFRRLIASSWTSNLGDGIGIAAAPLLVASQTDNALLVSSAVLLRGLPWLLFGLVAGAVADRVDRKRVVMAVDLARAIVLGLLCLALATGTASIALVLLAVFLVSTGKACADPASRTLLPMLLHRENLPLGNARLAAGLVGMN